MKECILLRLLNRNDWGAYQAQVERLRAWAGYGLFLSTLNALNYDALFDSRIHGPGHIERTLLHGAFCAMEEPLSLEDTRLLFLACCYHDVGRIDDSLDDLHGHRSAQQLHRLTGLTGEALKTVQAAVDAHSRSDNVLKKTAEGYHLADFSRGMVIAELLKDSDGLDRVRIWDLDPRFLRRSASKQRAAFAKELYLRYQNEAHLEIVPDFVQHWKHLDPNGNPLG